MPWIQLSDDYNDHPKFDNLSDGAFRLWHQVMGFCRKYRTDGMVPAAALKKFKAYSPKRARELLTPWTLDAQPLWHEVEGFGVQIHDYLDWNPSKDEDTERRSGSKERMRQLREERRRGAGVPPVSANSVLTAPPCLDPERVGWEGILVLRKEEENDRDPFDDFWAVYPRKVGKDAARRAWEKRRISAETAATIIAALAWQKQQDAWLRDGGRFIPNPATWINQGRWQDEPTTTPRISDSTLAMARATHEFLQS